LDDLCAVCTNVVLRYLNSQNLPAILTEASHLGVKILLEKLYQYIAVNLEALLESSLLDDIAFPILIEVGQGIRKFQMDHSPFVRSTSTIEQLLKQHQAWLDGQDIPRPILPNKKSPLLVKTKTHWPVGLQSSKEESLRFEKQPQLIEDRDSLVLDEGERKVNSGTLPKVWKASLVQDPNKFVFFIHGTALVH